MDLKHLDAEYRDQVLARQLDRFLYLRQRQNPLPLRIAAAVMAEGRIVSNASGILVLVVNLSYLLAAVTARI